MSADSGSMFGSALGSDVEASVGDNHSLESSHIDSYVVCHNRSHLAFTVAQQLSLQVSAGFKSEAHGSDARPLLHPILPD